MSHYYFDSSALVKRYIVETGTNWLNNICLASAEHTLYTVRISGAEIVAALYRHARTGSLSLPETQRAVAQFKMDFNSRYQIVEVNERLINSAMDILERRGLRGYDSVQLAAALELQNVRTSLSLSAVTFVCADVQLNLAAMAEGLLVENPNDH